MSENWELKFNELRTQIEKRRDRNHRDTEPESMQMSLNELKWLNSVLEKLPRLTLIALARQTRFLFERETNDARLKALAIILPDFCQECGGYIGKYSQGCECSPVAKDLPV